MRHSLVSSIVLVLLVGTCHAQGPTGRLVVLGFDGLDFNRVRSMGDRLPHLAALAEEGVLKPLESTTPAISPVSWSALITGKNPGRTGIDDFLRRDFSAGDYRVRLSMGRKEIDRSGFASRARRRPWLLVPAATALAGMILLLGRGRRGRGIAVGLLAALFSGALWVSETSLPDGRPRAINLRQEEAYWETLDAAGITTSTTFAPCSFPAPELRHGHLLCGLGVPDLAGGMGAWTLLRDDIATEATTETGGRLVPLVWRDKSRKPGEIGVCEPVMIQGPEDPLRFDGTPMEKPIVLNADPKTGVVHVTDGVETREIAKGAWSEPFDFLFRSSPWFRVRGQSRFKLVDIDQSLRVYLDPIGFHPGELPSGVRLSSPEDHAWNLWQETGPFETVGWACATNALKDGMIDDRTFLEDARRVWDEEERIALHELADLDKRVVTAIFTVPDRIQHMFMRYEWMDRDQSGRRVDPRMAQAIEEAYLRVDAFVGRVRRERMRKGDAILVVSDHGFAPWRRAVNLNSFLVREGLMTLDGPTATRSLREQVDQSSALGEIDWSRTQAYSIGLGHIYLNLEGREPRGIVKPSEVEPLIARITEALMKLRDGEAPVVAVASRGDRAMVGTAIPEGAAEIYVGFHRGYRVSWQSCLGGANEAIVSENVNAWSGDHCSVDPREVPGVLLTDLKLGEGAARVVDVGPTILDWAGLAPAAGDPADGHSLLAR